jgi:hypothetical protein
MKDKAVCAGLLALLSFGSAAVADSVCNAGYRDTTPAERARMASVMETIRGALPAPATGWVIGGDESLSVPQSLCQDYAKVPLNYGFSRLYRNAAGAEQQMKTLNDAAAIEAETYKKKQPRLEAIQAQLEATVARQVPLFEKGDIAGAQKYDAEIARLQAEYQKVADEGNNPAALEAAAKQANRDSELTITVHVNPMTLSTPPQAKPTARPAGAGSAYRWHVEDESQSNDHALYYFGAWFKRPDGTLQPSVRAGAPFSAAHAITVEVTGDPVRVTQTLAAMDFGKIASSLK